MLSGGRRGPEVDEPFTKDVAEDRFGVLLPLSCESWWHRRRGAALAETLRQRSGRQQGRSASRDQKESQSVVH